MGFSNLEEGLIMLLTIYDQCPKLKLKIA